jgi:hypothetical protein
MVVVVDRIAHLTGNRGAAPNKLIRDHGDDAWFDWPESPRIEAEVAA